MSDLKYTKEHEWLRLEADGNVTIGISDYAQDQLGDVVYVELPEVGTELQQGEDAVVIESVKTADEIRAPLTGTVITVNERLADEPETVNSEPTGAGWFLQMTADDPAQLDDYMNEAVYEEYIANL